jgi:hypothetical protein
MSTTDPTADTAVNPWGLVRTGTAGVRAFLRGDDLDLARRDGGIEVRLTGAIVLVGTLLSTLFHLTLTLFTTLEWPYTTFLYDPKWRFYDFVEVYANVQQYGRNGETNLVYSGLLHLITLALTQLPSVAAWLLVSSLFMVTLVLVVWFGVTVRIGRRVERDAYLAVFCLLSYPVLMVLDRGNLEMIVFMFLAGFAYLYYVRGSSLAWLPLSLAITGKYYWAVLLVLLLTDRQWRQFCLTLAGTIGMTLGSAALLGSLSGLGFGGVVSSTFSTLNAHMGAANSAMAMQHAHSFFAFPYFLDRSTDYWLQVHFDLPYLYSVFALAVFAMVTLRLVFYEVEAWRKLTALVVCAIALPFESHDYTMIHLLLPLALIGAWGAKTDRGKMYCVVFGLLLVPLDYVQFGFLVSYSSLAYAVLLLVLLVSVLTDRLQKRTVPLWKRAGGTGARGVT